MMGLQTRPLQESNKCRVPQDSILTLSYNDFAVSLQPTLLFAVKHNLLSYLDGSQARLA